MGAAVVHSVIDLWTGPSSFELDLWVVDVLEEGEARLKTNGETQMKRKRRQAERHKRKRPHWFSVSTSRCRCIKRLENLICDIL